MALWTPDEITTALWLDASDSATLSLSGSAVITWADKSGNNYNPTQATSGNRPAVVSAGLNGLDVVSFDGTNDRLAFTSGADLVRNVSGALAFVVCKHDATPSASRIPLGISINTSNLLRLNLAGGTTGKFTAGGRRLDADSFGSVDSAATIDTNWHIQAGVWDYSNSDLHQYIDGTLDGSNTSFQTAGNSSNTAAASVSIGSGVAVTAFHDGRIAEIIVIHNDVTAGTRALIEGYLAWKWGLEANLPGGHPFENAAPQIHTVPVGTAAVSAASQTVGFVRALKCPVTTAAIAVSANAVTLLGPNAEILSAASCSYTVTTGVVGLSLNALWSPEDIVTQLWLDASDPFTVLHSANAVTQWIDKSGSAYSPVQVTETDRPTRVAADLNSLDVISFDGTNDRLQYAVSNSLFRGIAVAAVFLVGKFNVQPTASRNLLSIDTSATTRAQLYGTSTGVHTTGGRQDDLDSFVGVSSAAVTGTNWFFRSALFDFIASNLYQYIDGVLDGSTTSFHSDGYNEAVATATINVGASSAPSQFLNGRLAEIIVVQGNISSALRETIEGYLAWKWGLEANLPGGHPYESSPPVGGTDAGLYQLPAVAAEVIVSTTSVALPRRLSVATAAYVATAATVNLRPSNFAVAVTSYVVSSGTVNFLSVVTLPVTLAAYSVGAPTVNFVRSVRVAVSAVGYTVGYSVTNLLRILRLVAQEASVAVTAAATALRGRRRLAAVAQFLHIGTPSTSFSLDESIFELPITATAYIAGAAGVALGRRYTLSATTQSYAATASSANLRRGRYLASATQAYVVTLVSAGALYVRRLAVAAAAFTAVSSLTSFFRGERVTAATADVVCAGSASFLRRRRMPVAAASYILSWLPVGNFPDHRLLVTHGEFIVNCRLVGLNSFRLTVTAPLYRAGFALAVDRGSV